MADARPRTLTLSEPYAAAAALKALPRPIPPDAPPRAVLKAEIERLIHILDHLDGHPDFELVGENVEEACEDEGADVDFPERWDAGTEPSLGSSDGHVDQTHWAAGAADDRELEACL